MSFSIYPEYKYSGIEWLGEVPVDWDMVPLKYLCDISGGGTPEKDNLEYWNGDIPWVSPKDMKASIISSSKDKITDLAIRESPISLIEPGAVLIVVRSGILQRTIPVGINSVDVTINQDIKALRFSIPGFEHYFRYLIRGLESSWLLEWRKQGATVESVEQEYLASSLIPVPPALDLIKILAFLDHETTKIDALIREQERLIELLEEKRQAVISHAVTKGLDPDVPMKDSGVEWLGEVPEHWEVARLKHMIRTRGGSTPSKENQDYWNGEIPWVSPKDMKRRRISDSIDHVSERAVDETGLSLIKTGSVLIVVRGMILAHSVPVAITDTAVTINQDMKALESGPQLNSEYLLLLLSGIRDAIFEYIDASAHGTKKLEWERFEAIELSIPPLEEQSLLVSKVEKLVSQVDDLIREAGDLIGLLQERRASLISEAVTGKIDIREWRPKHLTPGALEAAEEATT